MAYISHKHQTQVVKHTMAVLAMATLLVSLVTPGVAQASTGGTLLALLTQLSAANAAEEPSFPTSEDRKPVKTMTVVATAYTSREAETDSTPCITANGHDLCKQYTEDGEGNSIAVNGLKFGTQVKFPEMYGDKIFVVRDRMNARYTLPRIDIWMPELSEARTFGVKTLKMEIYN